MTGMIKGFFGVEKFGWLDVSRDFLGGIQNNLKTLGSACVITSDGMMEKQTQTMN